LAGATGYETNGTLRGNENFGYGYDGAENQAFRTNNTLIQAFTSDNANELVNVTRNNNLLTVGGNVDPGQVSLARRLRAETTMTLAWIADRLKMGSWSYVSNLLNDKTNQTISINSED